jgi:hypothetical protein
VARYFDLEKQSAAIEQMYEQWIKAGQALPDLMVGSK